MSTEIAFIDTPTLSHKLLFDKSNTIQYNSTLDDFLQKYKYLHGLKLENYVRKISENRFNFNKIINLINEEPEGLLLDHLKNILIKFDANYYEKVISYIRNERLDTGILEHLIEAVERWDAIAIEKRQKDCKEILDNLYESHPIEESLIDALRNIKNGKC